MNDVSTSLSGQPVAQDTAKRPSHGLWTGHRLALSHSLSPNALKTYSGPRRRLLVAAALVAGDVVASPGGALVAGAAATYPVAAVTAAFLIAAYFGLGLYAGYGPSPCERFRLRALGVLAFFAADLLVAASVGFNVGALAAAVCTGVLLLVLGYYTEGIIRRLLVQRDLWGATAALVGCDEGSSKLAKRLMAEPELGLRPLGFVSEDTDQQPGTLPLPFLGTLRDMARVGEQAEVLIFASRRRLTVDETAWRSHIGKVLVVEDAQDLQSLWLNTRTLGSSVGVEIRRGLYVAPNLWLKRGIDILIALPVGLLVLPLIGVLALVIKTVDPGPAFYVQSRVGRAGRPLRVVKLRTMYRDAERRLEDQLGQDPLHSPHQPG